MTKAEKYLKDLNNKFPNNHPLGELVIGSGYSYKNKRYIVTAEILTDFSNTERSKELDECHLQLAV